MSAGDTDWGDLVPTPAPVLASATAPAPPAPLCPWGTCLRLQATFGLHISHSGMGHVGAARCGWEAAARWAVPWDWLPELSVLPAPSHPLGGGLSPAGTAELQGADPAPWCSEQAAPSLQPSPHFHFPSCGSEPVIPPLQLVVKSPFLLPHHPGLPRSAGKTQKSGAVAEGSPGQWFPQRVAEM